MAKKYTPYLWFVLLAVVISSCSDDSGYSVIEPDPVSPVVFDIENVPYQTLSEYNFFEGSLRDLEPVYGVLPYTLNSTLFTDYAKKKRFIWLPKGVKASYVNDYSALDFPTGTVLIKNFYYENVIPNNTTKILETRVMIKLETGWDFANYVWNEEQTEAYYTNEGSVESFSWIEMNETKSVNSKIPRRAECFTCHSKQNTPLPIGVKPQNLNRTYDFEEGSMNQLYKLIDQGYLDNNLPTEITSTVNWKDTSQPLELRVRSYLDINCAHCHSDQGYCNYTHIRFGFEHTDNIENLGVCVENDFQLGGSDTHIVKPNDPIASALFMRLSSTEDEIKMPLIGRTLVHDKGITLIEEWINSIQTTCN